MAFTVRTAFRWLLVFIVAALAVFIAGCNRAGDAAAPGFRGIDLTGAPYGRNFRLTDADGRERTLADYKGKAVLMYFGFVQCPDVCPTALIRAAKVKQLLGADGDKLQVIFITIDPERDTPEVIKAYTAAFDPSFIGLYGDAKRTRETADEFKVYYKQVPTGSSYTMDHSALSYAFDPQGRLRLALRHEQTAEDYAHDLRQLLAGK
ncbi:SCO family protein [Candidatus Skiveiella danica]|jgi:protein SCO1/2|uniref:SCO family protein n=1 Tax=Candidatus Skiveiella danica TaxID=3386177 RepID=UPI001B50FCE5|nr:SCO family protein [Comamonadaceae bacterium]MBK9198195.1 SCO family protein [Betaproteobacteria bacterium]MBP7966328.1 SCO family protein [Burkholderiaceae bacterium]MBK6559301.1 SCO family protein [Comamonadaceae bacterium]MBK7507744.1 SCO family protein [Comamonadaceae bacterium]